ncbi:hypothetical protein EPUS_00050 [Endocarpon pusillum Z07020]|uniref:Uncharacterized protein n=1 Tax=Endocarpon pusillum (strain Z07020 / HMAS-L-300199) TaxID=1263415 RepID=U1GSA6_ENDPU|nr:uncharacterized protein EPUS_00050 [Endocarpon pusillum Z07020]ERF75258.1 hypothetical protein EPUS_00050 [Endocarpon pusillum Z07020]
MASRQRLSRLDTALDQDTQPQKTSRWQIPVLPKFSRQMRAQQRPAQGQPIEQQQTQCAPDPLTPMAGPNQKVQSRQIQQTAVSANQTVPVPVPIPAPALGLRPIKVRPSEQQPAQAAQAQVVKDDENRETEIRGFLRRQHKILLTAIDAIQRDRQIMAQSQETIDSINAKSCGNWRQMSATDVKDLRSEKNRRKLWKRAIEEKMEACRKMIESMDKAEAELRTIRPLTRDEKRNDAYVSKEQRLAVGAPVEGVGRESVKGKWCSSSGAMEIWENDLRLAYY